LERLICLKTIEEEENFYIYPVPVNVNAYLALALPSLFGAKIDMDMHMNLY
jgi:hypothetical protein